IEGNRPVDDYVSFTPLGEPRRVSGALQMGTFTLCRPGHDAVEVVLAATGRVRTNRTRTRCP
ncbi:MAG: type IV fimbrial biogenesis protein FimT, partial [Betaproteobacteria bacterium PRO3]|nr:type IV fimbrial biogenesis protein FimT [Betaproteobacteria bacterium PRO3]